MSTLFGPALLIFTVPLLVASALGVLALAGMLDFEMLDFDADLGGDIDADAGADAPGGSVLQLLGIGFVPLSLVLTILCFSFGWVGLLLASLVGMPIAGVLGSNAGASVVLAVPALLGAGLVTGPFARLLQPFFQDYGQADRARDFIGRPGVLTTSDVDTSFGTAAVEVPGRGRVEVSARATSEHGPCLACGDRVLLYDYDAEQSAYFVAPFEGGAEG